ncbi:MAG: CopD family protein [Gammaproteobacteria bacterium]
MLWIKAFHIIFMVTWFAGLFYLPRLFVYHSQTDVNPESSRRFAIMEKRLFAITTVGAALTIFFGLWLLIGWFWPPPFWLEIKLGLVLGLIAYHILLGYLVTDLRTKPTRRSPTFYRILNEIPTFFLIAIVLLAVLRPAL